MDMDSPERALWLGVLVQAIDDYRGRALRGVPGAATIQHDAQDFLFSEARRPELELVADAAGVEVEALREAALRAGERRTSRIVGQRRCGR